jgi:TRAP-type transport system periplasmic protein
MMNPSILSILKLALLGAWISLFFTGSPLAAEKGSVIKLATLAPEGSSWIKAFQALNQEMMKKTENKVQFRIYPGGVLGDERDMLRKMKIGQIQGAVLTSAGLSTLYGEIDVLQVPFLFQSYEEVDLVLKKTDAFFRKGFEEKGYSFLGWTEAGFIYLMSKLPISGVADLRKGKVWIWEESPMSKAILDEAGVTAIPLSVPDVLVGLQTGLVDVVYVPPTGAIALQWFTKINYMTDVPLAYLAGAVIVTKDVFERMSPPDRKLVLEACQRHLDQLKTVTRNENQEAIRVMMKQGVKIVPSSKDHIAEFKRLSEKAMDRIGGDTFSKKTLNDVKSILEDYRKGAK